MADARGSRGSIGAWSVQLRVPDCQALVQIFDRLQKIGVCLSYVQSKKISIDVAGHFKADLIDAVKSGSSFRLIGDNCNYRVNVQEERIDRHGKLHHDFTSAAIVQLMGFEDLDNTIPLSDYQSVDHTMFLPSDVDCHDLKKEYAVHMARVAVRMLPCFQFLKDVIPKYIQGQYSKALARTSKVIPLPVLVDCNEQNYNDAVRILDFYEDTVNDIYEQAGLSANDHASVHIGGDQLTRERFSGAKRLRIGGTTMKERFDHLTPITFELFHMQINYLTLMFKVLYRDGSVLELGTMHSEQKRIMRRNVNEDVKNAYDADENFTVSFIDAYIVEALLEFFGMENVNSIPTKNVPPSTLCSREECRDWMEATMFKLIDKFVWPRQMLNTDETVVVDGDILQIKLADGTPCTLWKKPAQPHEQPMDYVKNYAHMVLELGLLFKSINDLCKIPDRDRAICILKMAMITFKANNNLSKYALEILRFLVHQLCTMTEQQAHREFYGLFVNTKGHIDSFIPADRQMEYIVTLVKKNMKHMCSNKTETNIKNVTSALAGVQTISNNFDNISEVIVRAKKHNEISTHADEIAMVDDLRHVRPFRHTPGRFHPSFPRISSSIQHHLNVHHFHAWIQEHTVNFATEHGN
ncbi:uncharacterized protein [Ptychodera flava]|uniref:uncharacterized protein n=1 Tax=Ptychodera flava TaxID=63121 RepID=UPI00396A5D37